MASRSQKPPVAVTRDRFLVWRCPRRGVFNGQRMSNPVWEWLLRSRWSSWKAQTFFEAKTSMESGPCWSAQRYGQSRTELGDGRVVEIGGEHEDHYDPDFFIYNDVIIRGPGRTLELFGYPTHVFPPTDFHSASLVGERIITIGALGYPDDRRSDETPVFALDTSGWTFARLKPRGEPPGWLYGHKATTEGHRLTLTGGSRVVVVSGAQHIVDNFDDWQLDLKALSWRRLTKRPWQQWSIDPIDPRHLNRLFEIEMLTYHRALKSDFDREQVEAWKKRYGPLPDFKLFEGRYQPPVHFVALPQREDEPREHCINLDGVRVRFVEESRSVAVTFEGKLPPKTVTRVLSHVVSTLTALEGAAYGLMRVQ